MTSSTENTVYDVLKELPNYLTPRISGNLEISEKSQKWVEAESGTQSPLPGNKIPAPVVKNYAK